MAQQRLQTEEGDDEASAQRRDKLKRHLERQKELDAAAHDYGGVNPRLRHGARTTLATMACGLRRPAVQHLGDVEEVARAGCADGVGDKQHVWHSGVQGHEAAATAK